MEQHHKGLIISGGELSVPAGLEKHSFDLILACDRGYEYAQRLGITPDLILGDYDSAEAPDVNVPFVVFPKEKDDTDTMLAIKHAIHMGCSEITLLCALGNRIDHAFANIQACAYAACQNVAVTILSETAMITVFPPSARLFPYRTGWSLSLFALSDTLTGVTIENAKYPLENATLTNTFPVGTSNEWLLGDITIRTESGIAMVIQSRLEEDT